MQVIELDASRWTDSLAYYQAVLDAVDAPFWHGRNVNALIDSLIWGGINGRDSPYHFRICNLGQASADAREEFKLFLDSLPEQREEFFAQNGVYPDVLFDISS